MSHIEIDFPSYDRACKEAATRQGLDPVTAALREAGVTHAVEQTGGFCMVVTVPHKSGHWGITNEEGITLCWYADKPEDEDDGVEDEVLYPDTFAEMLGLIRAPYAD